MKVRLTFPFYVSFFIMVSYSILPAQVDTLWTRTIGGPSTDYGNSVQQTMDGGYIMTGRSYLPDTSGSVWLVKTDASGDTIWTKHYGHVKVAYGNSVQQTTDGGYIVAGADWPSGYGNSDVFLVKTNSSGDTLWTREFGGSDGGEGSSVQQTADGGYIIVGNTYSSGTGLSDVWLIKTNSSGDTLWTRTFGGSKTDEGNSVQQTKDGGYIIVGNTYSFGAGSGDVWLIKTNSSGDTLWTRTFGGSENDKGYSVRQTKDGGYIVTGITNSFNAGNEWLIKTDESGDTLWTRIFSGLGSSVLQTKDGGYIIAGETDSFGAGLSDVWLIKTNSSGDSLWTRTFGGVNDEGASSIEQTTDGGYIIAGLTDSFGNGIDDALLIKTTTDVTDVNQNDNITISNYSLLQNYPNPFNPSTKIDYSVPNANLVTIKVYDVLGREITTLVNGYKQAGKYEIEFNAANQSGGVYFYRLKAGNYTSVKKMLLLK